MDFDLQWLLIALPVVFALGWMASRIDLRQVRRDGREAPKAYFKGLNLLLNEQHDKAIDAFIEAVQHDPDTTELHFGLGNLFRRRGDFERAVRVHQHLLERADLKAVDRHRAQHALADDFMKAGLFDRAEAAYKALEGTAFDTEARIAHYACELALQADAAGQPAQADEQLQRAREIAPRALRPRLLAGQRLARAGQHAAALQQWDELLAQHPAAWPLVASDYARSALACADCSAAFERLQAAYEAEPDLDLLQACIEVEGASGQHERLLLDHLQRQPTLGAAAKVLELPVVQWDATTPQQLRQVVAAAARPLHRYRCAACGFEAHHYFWQCPGCQGWDTYPPKRMESS